VRAYRLLLLVAALTLPAGCVTVPAGLSPVRGFTPQRYLGTWYEIARLDHSFERGLTRVRASYSLRDDGGLAVLNEGWNAKAGAWQSARGRAYFVDAPDVGFLKVSFFGPFYGSYVVFALDPDYRWALVSGPTRSYLWILCRDPHPSAATVDTLIARARAAGFDTDKLIRVAQDDAAAPGDDG
jgi:apolipoprotein D and lipocalin family protein